MCQLNTAGIALSQVMASQSVQPAIFSKARIAATCSSTGAHAFSAFTGQR